MEDQIFKTDIVHDRENRVVKDNVLIQGLVKRRYELSVTEQKALCFILSKIPSGEINHQKEGEITFDIRHFCEVCGISSTGGESYNRVKSALERLSNNGFWIETPENTKLYFQWIVTPEIIPDSGIVNITIPSKIMPYVSKLSEKFTSYQLFNILALKSTYSITLYELFRSWLYKGTFIIDISALREYLGIGAEKYSAFKEFKRAVLDKAIKEIEAYTDIRVEYRLIRQGRKYNSIEFTVSIVDSFEGAEAYRRAMAEINGIKHDRGQINIFE